MTRWMVVTFVLCLGLVGRGSAADGGTAAQAKAMLDRTAAAMKSDKMGTLAQITKGGAGFRDGDLYAFCGGPDGTYTAHGASPGLVGKSLKQIKDDSGKAVGEEIYKAAHEGRISEVAYVWPRPGSTNAVPKVAFVTKVGDQVCAVGYYP